MAFPDGWQHFAAITIHADKVAGTAGLAGFPVLLTAANLPADMFDADGAGPALNGGGDVRFSSDSAGAAQLACEIVEFVTDPNPANGSAIIWVKVPSLSASVDTTIYVWYSKTGESQPAITDPFGRNAVWAGYGAALHLRLIGGEYIDSAGNIPAGSITAGTVTPQAAPFGEGIHLDPARIVFPFNAAVGALSSYYISFWLKPDDGRDSARILGSLNGEQSSAGNHIIVDTGGSQSGRPRLAIFNLSGSDPAQDDFLADAGQWDSAKWYYVTFNALASSQRVTVDDTSRNFTFDGTSAYANNTDAAVLLGVRTSSEALVDPYAIGEIRIRDGAPPDDWIATEYNNQSSPATFATAGTPESAGGGAAAANFGDSLQTHSMAIASGWDSFSGAAVLSNHAMNGATPWDWIDAQTATHGHHIGQAATGAALIPSSTRLEHLLPTFSGKDRLIPQAGQHAHLIDAWGLPAPAPPNRRIIHPHRQTTARIARASRRHGATGT